MHLTMLIAHPYPLIQIGETDVEKLVAYLDINKMRENPMVRDQQSTYMSMSKKEAWTMQLTISMSKNAGMVVIRWRYVGYQVNKEVEKPATAEAPSFIRFFFFFPSFFFTVFVCCISSFKTCNCTDYQLLPKNAFPIVFFFSIAFKKVVAQ